MDEEYENRRENEEKERKTIKSRQVNEAKIDVQKERNRYLEKLAEDLKERLKERLRDHHQNKTLLVSLLVQGLVKLCEREVVVFCKAGDVDIVKSVKDQAENEFKEIMRAQSRSPDFSCRVVISEDRFLDEEEAPLGGVVLSCQHSSITCTNTIDNRVELCLKESMPTIRAELFPSLSARA